MKQTAAQSPDCCLYPWLASNFGMVVIQGTNCFFSCIISELMELTFMPYRLLAGLGLVIEVVVQHVASFDARQLRVGLQWRSLSHALIPKSSPGVGTDTGAHAVRNAFSNSSITGGRKSSLTAAQTSAALEFGPLVDRGTLQLWSPLSHQPSR